MKKSKKSISIKKILGNSGWVFNIIFLAIVIGLIYYGVTQGLFKINNITYFQNQTNTPISQTPSTTQPAYSSCSQLCNSNSFSKSYSATSCKAGETLIIYGYPNQAPLLSCCCYNEEAQCSVSVDKTTISEGESVVGTIIDGANTKCEIFMNKDNSGWIKSEEGTTDANGKLVITNSLVEGIYQFYVKCGSCTTNTLTITSNPGVGGLLCSEVVSPSSQQSCDIANCVAGNICTFVKVFPASTKCECKTPDAFCSQSCTNSYFPGGRGPVSGIASCNLQVESPFIQGYGDGKTSLCCCNNFDIIGCGRYGGSFGYTRNSLVMPESTLNYCSEVAFSDCQSTGKAVKNYNLVSTCCMWNCE